MNVSFKGVRRFGDKAYILSEISGYDERLPVVLAASTDDGSRIPSDTFPYCDVDDPIALQQVLFDGALANRDMPLPPLHTHNSAEVRFFVITLPWLDVRRWNLEFRAIDSSGNVAASCRKALDVRATGMRAFADQRTSPATGALIEDLDGRFIHDRIHVSFLRALDQGEKSLVSALVEMPYHEESAIEFDFLDRRGRSCPISFTVVEDTVAPSADFGSPQRRFMEVSFEVDARHPQVCFCATDTAGTIAPGFAMLGTRTFGQLIGRFRSRTTSAYDDPGYHEWFLRHRADVPALLEQVAARFDLAPLFSIVCIVSDVPAHHVHDFCNSVAQQSYGRWELILVDVAGDNQQLADLKGQLDAERVYVVNVDPSHGVEENLRAGMAAVEGDFVVLMRASEILAPNALFECVRTINEWPDCDVIYTDVDTVDAQGIHSHPVFRPAFSPELLRSYNYIRNLVAIRTSLLEEAAPRSVGIMGPSGYDLALRVTEAARRVCHIPQVLCHVRFVAEHDGMFSLLEQEAGRKALVAHCRRVGINAEVLNEHEPCHYRVRHVLADSPHVVVVIPSEGNAELLGQCVRSLYAKVRYKNFEVVVADASGGSEEVRACLADLEASFDTLSALHWEGDFNRARIANHVAAHTEGEYLLFLNNDTRVLNDDALEVMLGYFQSAEVGVVGPKQLFVDGTIEHAGIAVGGSNGVTPLFRHMASDWHGYLDRAVVAQNVSAVTDDCMMVRRVAFDAVGGFDDAFSLFYAGVDFCLKAHDAGYLTVFTPHVCFSHLRSVSRVRTHSKSRQIALRREVALLQASWPRLFVEGDAFYNPNLDPDSSYFALGHKGGGSLS